MSTKIENIFEVDSIYTILALCVFTLGIYVIYKLYKLSSQINNYSNYQISIPFMSIATLLFSVSFVSLLIGLLLMQPEIIKSSIALHVISTIFDVSWIIMVRNRINLINNVQKGDELWLNPVITSIFHVIYMQHKINQAMVQNDI